MICLAKSQSIKRKTSRMSKEVSWFCKWKLWGIEEHLIYILALTTLTAYH
jgi:hypothetical protein